MVPRVALLVIKRIVWLSAPLTLLLLRIMIFRYVTLVLELSLRMLPALCPLRCATFRTTNGHGFASFPVSNAPRAARWQPLSNSQNYLEAVFESNNVDGTPVDSAAVTNGDRATTTSTPSFDRALLRLRHRASRRAGIFRGSPRSKSVFHSFVVRLSRAENGTWKYYGKGYLGRYRSAYSLKIAKHIAVCYRAVAAAAAKERSASAGVSQSSKIRDCLDEPHRWLVDSGANNHMVTNDTNCLPLTVQPCTGHISGVGVDIVGTGDCRVCVTTASGASLSAVIHSVKITPDLSSRSDGNFCRIFSVRQAINHGCTVSFYPSGGYLALPSGTRVPLYCENGLYWLSCSFPSDVTSEDVPMAAPSPVLSKSLMHRRLCHLHDDGIRRLSAMKISGIPQTPGMFQALPFCKCCTLAKSTVANICRQSTRDHDPPTCFYMMAVDIWGPVDISSIGGYKYVFGSICYLSGYHMAELLRTKDEAPAAWKRMLLQIRTLGYTVHVVRIDNDSVFLGSSFRAVC